MPFKEEDSREAELFALRERIRDLEKKTRQRGLNQDDVELGDGKAPPVEDLRILGEFQDDGVTTLVLSWSVPDDPFIEAFEIWVKDLSDNASSQELIAEVSEPPATLVLESDADTAKTLTVRTRMKNKTGTPLKSSPAVAADIKRLNVTGASLADGSVTTTKIADAAITTAKIALASIDTARIGTAQITNALIANLAVTDAKINDLSANKLTAGTIDANVINVLNLNADNITTGTLTAINVQAGTYTLISGQEQMLINGSDGFKQVNTTTHNRVGRIFQGRFTVGTFTTGEITVSVEHDGFRAGTDLTTGSQVITAEIRDNAGFGGIVRLRTGADELQVLIDAEDATFFENFGKIRLRANGSSFDQVKLQAKAADNAGDSLEINNTSGTWRIRAGVISSGNESSLSLNSATGGNEVSMRTGSSSLQGLYVGGTRVVGPQEPDPGAGPTTDELRTVLLNHGLIG